MNWFNTWGELLTVVISGGSLIAIIVGFWFTKRALDYNARALERSNAFANAANYHHAIEFQKDTWLALLQSDVDAEKLLAWHLEKRRMPVGSPVENKKTLFLMLRLDVYEELLLAHDKRLLDDNTIEGWIAAVHRDARDPEFTAMWEHVSIYYADVLQKEVKRGMASALGEKPAA